MNASRETILNAIRTRVPPRVEHPGIPQFHKDAGSSKEEFVKRLQEAGGAVYEAATPAEAEDKVKALHPTAKVICSAVREISGNRKIEAVHDPHELADVDVGIVRARLGVAEAGAVWLTEQDLGVSALAFLSQHLVVLLDPDLIVADMHAAYRQVRLDETSYGCFVMGPSATADVEATLVHGAQGPRSLNVLFMPEGRP